ncbi:multidrug efflux SMR transporter [Frankia sp. Cppng1_Ct_nod]|uniref:DMT family transporter n=1 Tax=Frankia sp. Cppng1_Ct_nod TaxID=2897162 RepID=UPI0010412D93|nr:multidrug efflux SMR transporter [Frankia sp. Cppng1_Ct_nod]
MAVVLQLAVAIVAEIVGTTSLRASDGFTRLWPSVLVCVCYPLSFYLLSLVLRQLSIGVAYAVWSAVGTAAIVIIGVVAYGESLTAIRVISLVLVVLGVIGLQLGGAHR